MDDKKSCSYHRPVWDDNGQFHYELFSQAKEKKHVSFCLVPPEQVIPVIFIPGVMGSNLKNGDGEVWQFSIPSLTKWPLANARKRKELLNPATTMVDYSGEIANNDADGKNSPHDENGAGAARFTKVTAKHSTGCSICLAMTTS